MRLSVLDQSPIPEGANGPVALRNTIDLAQLADSLGYHRYWLAEHHGMTMLAGTSPEVLIGPVASATPRIRVGSGGVMLPHYSALKVAEQFSVLSGLFPGRVDLAVGRAPGSDRETMTALQRDRRLPPADDFPEQLAELIAYVDDAFPEEHPFRRLAALPGRPERPDLHLLGSSMQSAIWAAQVGLPYAFADFINPGGEEYAQLYRDNFSPSAGLAEPYVIVCAAVVCADTDEEAERIASSWRMAFLQLRRNRIGPVPTVERALDFLSRDPSPGGGRRLIAGAPSTVRAGVEEVARAYGADEVMAVTIVHDHAARRRSYELLAEAFG